MKFRIDTPVFSFVYNSWTRSIIFLYLCATNLYGELQREQPPTQIYNANHHCMGLIKVYHLTVEYSMAFRNFIFLHTPPNCLFFHGEDNFQKTWFCTLRAHVLAIHIGACVTSGYDVRKAIVIIVSLINLRTNLRFVCIMVKYYLICGMYWYILSYDVQ